MPKSQQFPPSPPSPPTGHFTADKARQKLHERRNGRIETRLGRTFDATAPNAEMHEMHETFIIFKYENRGEFGTSTDERNLAVQLLALSNGYKRVAVKRGFYVEHGDPSEMKLRLFFDNKEGTI